MRNLPFTFFMEKHNKRGYNSPEEENTVVSLKLIEGGKDTSGSGPAGPWLMELPVNTTFLIKEVPTSGQRQLPPFVLGEYTLLSKTEKSVQLSSPNNPGPVWVEPNQFCRQFMKHEVLYTMVDEEETDG